MRKRIVVADEGWLRELLPIPSETMDQMVPGDLVGVPVFFVVDDPKRVWPHPVQPLQLFELKNLE